MIANKPSYFLVHVETGQRYPIKGAVIIGRRSGDIVFSKDTKLSNQHCEVSPSEMGLAVRDLHSANGTFIDGKQMAPDRNFLLVSDGKLRVGDQEFSLHTVTLTRNLRKRRKKRRNSVGESYGQVLFVLLAAIFAFGWYNHTTDRGTQIQLSQKQLGEIFETYQDLQMSLERQTAAPQEIGRRMQGQILGRLNSLARRWAEFQPGEGEQRQIFGTHLRFAAALGGRTKSQIMYIESADSKYLDEIDQWTDQLEKAVDDIHAQPTGQGFPALVQSPLQLVEREMRQALRDYKSLGAAVQAKEVSEREMGTRIRENLMPKMNSVYAKMGAIAPQNDFERRKVVLEQKLMTAFLGQVKSMSIVAESHDPKYVNELNHWTSEIEKVNRQLKQQLGFGRMPAGQDGPRNP